MEGIPDTPVRKKPKVIGLKALLAKKYDVLENLPEWMVRSFGQLVRNFIMIIWAQSSSGKSSLVYQLVAVLMKYGNVLYVSLERRDRNERSTEGTAAPERKEP